MPTLNHILTMSLTKKSLLAVSTKKCTQKSVTHILIYTNKLCSHTINQQQHDREHDLNNVVVTFD